MFDSSSRDTVHSISSGPCPPTLIISSGQRFGNLRIDCAALVAAEVPGQTRCLLRWAAGLSLLLLAVVEICLNVERTLVSGGSLLEGVIAE